MQKFRFLYVSRKNAKCSQIKECEKFREKNMQKFRKKLRKFREKICEKLRAKNICENFAKKFGIKMQNFSKIH